MTRDTDVLGKNADGGSRGATGKKSRTSMSFRTSVPIAIPGSRDASVAGPSKDSLPSLTGQLGRTRVQSHAESLHELKRKRSDKINLKSRSHAISSTDAHPTPNINPPFKNGKKSKKDIPYPATNAEQKRIALYHEFGGKYGSPDPDILEAFFGYGETEVAKDPKPLPPRLRDLYGYSPRSGAKVSASERSWLETAWIYVPKTPKKSTEADIEESAIVDALMPILDGLIKRLKDNNEIMAINCQNRPIETYDGGTLRPDIFIWATRDGAFMPAPRPGPGDKVSWKECHFVIEVKTERTRRLNLELPMTEVSGRPDLLQPSDWRLPGSHVVFQLGSYAREVFAAQPYRRCLPTLVLTECTAEFFLWDRAGLQYSDFFDYHKEKEKFLWIIGRLCHPETLFDGCGFDQTAKHTFYNHEPYLQINFGENDTSFLVNEALSHSYTLKSQGSVCYQGFRTGEKPNKVRYIIQDQWVSGITDPRCHMVSILRDRLAVISETKRLLDLSGVFEYYYHGVVEQRKTTLIDKRFVQGELEPDCIHRNRCYTGIEGVPNLVHSRTIWKINGGYCRTLTDFHTTLELIRALRDVVEVLMVLYLRHGIVHREITPWSILLHRPDGDCMEPRRGVLIDFSWSTVIDKHSGSAEARIDTTPGAQLFMSRNALNGRTSRPLDDIESIFWLLLWICGAFRGPKFDCSAVKYSELPPEITQFMNRDLGWVARAKQGYIFEQHDAVTVQPQFPGEAHLRMLLTELRGFFADTQRPRNGSQKDFKDILGYFDDAIKALTLANGPKATETQGGDDVKAKGNYEGTQDSASESGDDVSPPPTKKRRLNKGKRRAY